MDTQAWAADGVLMDDVAGDGEQVGLGTSDGLVPFDSEEAKEDFLREVWHVVGIPGPDGQEPAQATAVSCGDGGDEIAVFGGPIASMIP